MKVVTANHLTGGHVVFQSKAGTWSAHLADAAIYVDEAALDAGLKAAAHDSDNQIIVGAYEIDVEKDGSTIKATKFREHIRAVGPTTTYGDAVVLGSQNYE